MDFIDTFQDSSYKSKLYILKIFIIFFLNDSLCILNKGQLMLRSTIGTLCNI